MLKQRTFPADKLVPAQGCIRAMIYEDPASGREQDMFWGIDVEFAPLRYRGERLRPEINCDWMIFDIQDWRELAGAEIEGAYDDIEATFTAGEADFAQTSKVRFLERDGADFRIRYDMVVDFSGWDEEDADSNLEITAELVVPYLGFFIDREILLARPGQEQRAREIAAGYVDLDCYQEPRIDGETFHFDPRP